MRLTPRCLNLLRLLRAARWLSTRQVQRRFFPEATADAARKRLRKLTAEAYLVMVRENRMEPALFTLGRAGQRMLEAMSGSPVTLERKPPAQREHFLAVNDLRIAAELTGSLSYFFAYWELPALGWRHGLIPDGLFALKGGTYALEVDRGFETIRLFMRTKVTAYRRGLDGLPLTAVLVVADRHTRMVSLANAIGDTGGRMLFSTLDVVRAQGLLAPVFHRTPGDAGVSLV